MARVRKRFLASLIGLVLTGSVATAEPCRSESFEEASYTVCSFDLAKDDLRLFWKDAGGAPYRTFDALRSSLEAEAQTLMFAMNAGMYGEDFAPIGLYVEEKRELASANTETITGEPGQIPNFYKKPNGIFYVANGNAGVSETDAYLKSPPEARFATQSGPMLVIDGKIHPAFIVDSTDRKRRNGVGVSSPTEIHFVITEGRVNFHDFARFFRDGLGCANALFFDGGTAPGLYAPELGRDDSPGHGGYGPIVGVVK